MRSEVNVEPFVTLGTFRPTSPTQLSTTPQKKGCQGLMFPKKIPASFCSRGGVYIYIYII